MTKAKRFNTDGLKPVRVRAFQLHVRDFGRKRVKIICECGAVWAGRYADETTDVIKGHRRRVNPCAVTFYIPSDSVY